MAIYNPPPTPTSTSGTSTPTTLQTDLIIASYTQMLFKRRIVTQPGQRIIIGTDAALVGV